MASRATRASGYIYLDFSTLLRLGRLAKQGWVYLAAERSTRPAGCVARSPWAVGAAALASLAPTATSSTAPLAPRSSGLGASSSYESVTVERRPGGWSLVAVKLDAAERRRRETEHERFMQAVAASLLPDTEATGLLRSPK